jgi:hypothetical protein
MTTIRESVSPVTDGSVVAIIFFGRNRLLEKFFRPRLPKMHLSCVYSFDCRFGNVIDCSVYASARQHNREGKSNVTSSTYDDCTETHLVPGNPKDCCLLALILTIQAGGSYRLSECMK